MFAVGIFALGTFTFLMLLRRMNWSVRLHRHVSARRAKPARLQGGWLHTCCSPYCVHCWYLGPSRGVVPQAPDRRDRIEQQSPPGLGDLPRDCLLALLRLALPFLLGLRWLLAAERRQVG